jgi:hypothetical protein
MSLSSRIRVSVVVAAAAAGIAGAVGVADAAASHPAPPAPHSAGPDAGVPSDGVHPDAPVTAPDGTRIGNTREGAAPATGARVAAASSSLYAYTTVSNARIRASVPSGTVLATVRSNAPGLAGCKIPGRDGYLWGWVGFNSLQTGRFTYGWMRGDLFQVALSGGAQGGASYLPWC